MREGCRLFSTGLVSPRCASLTLPVSQQFLSASAHMPLSFQHRVHPAIISRSQFSQTTDPFKACIWEYKQHWKNYLSVSKADLQTTISPMNFSSTRGETQPNSPRQEHKICLEGQRTVIHSFACPRGIRWGKVYGTWANSEVWPTCVLTEEATAFP